jgi:molybdopterin/thiamine biosynthesis adenylyltransferase
MTVQEFLMSRAQNNLLPWEVQKKAADSYGFSLGEIEEIALEMDLLPARYKQNRKSLSISHQLQLFQSEVSVVGCGGLGGFVIEELARLGIGHIKAIDPDIFEEHNLNRQIFSTIDDTGKYKVEVAAKRVETINPAVTLLPLIESISKNNGFRLLRKTNLVVDALDSIPTRLELAEICKKLKIPLVHGSIAGWYGQVSTQLPGENTLKKIYSSHLETKGIETELGNLPFTAGIVASIEAAEACKLLLNHGTPLKGRILMINLLDAEIIDLQI